jgi:hypothetical protein
MKNNYLITVILVVVFAAAGFYGGTMYQKNQTLSGVNGSGFGAGAGGRGGAGGQFAGRRNGGGQVVGTVLTQDSSSITVKLADGSSKIVLLSGTTSYNKSAPASASDLKVGDRVAIFGATNSDGSLNATSVQLNPISRVMNDGTPAPTGGVPAK